MQPAQLASALRTRLAPVVEQAGYDLEDVVVTPAGKRRAVRLSVDKDGGVTLDECAEVSRAVSGVLDRAEDLLGEQPYTLEVSSPGVSRPLTLPRHWRRSVGRLVRVRRIDGSTITGRVLSSGETTADLRVDDTVVPQPYHEVDRAVVQVELRSDSSGG